MEISWNFVSPKKWEPCLTLNDAFSCLEKVRGCVRDQWSKLTTAIEKLSKDQRHNRSSSEELAVYVGGIGSGWGWWWSEGAGGVRHLVISRIWTHESLPLPNRLNEQTNKRLN